MRIMEIDDLKIADVALKRRKKAERENLGLSEEEEEPLKLELPPLPTRAGRKKKLEHDPEVIERATQVALLKREIKQYGVSISSSLCSDPDYPL